MKKIILAPVLLFVCFNFCYGQQPWCPAGATWYYRSIWFAEEGYSKRTVDKDTTINGFPGQKIREINHTVTEVSWTYVTDTGYQYFYNDSGVILGSNTSNLSGNVHPFDTIYNFNAAPGDKWTYAHSLCGDTAFIVVTDTGTMMINGQRLKFKKVNFTAVPGNQYPPSDTFVERIGFLNADPFNLDVCSIDGINTFLCSYKDSTFNIYPHPDSICTLLPDAVVNGLEPNSFFIYPNPAHDVISIQIGVLSEQAEVILYDMEGRIFLNQQLTESKQNKVDVSGLPGGIFLVELRNKNGTNRQLLVKD